jgi:hypothetical protein
MFSFWFEWVRFSGIRAWRQAGKSQLGVGFVWPTLAQPARVCGRDARNIENERTTVY